MKHYRVKIVVDLQTDSLERARTRGEEMLRAAVAEAKREKGKSPLFHYVRVLQELS